MATGDWTLCYEADSNNTYSATFLIQMPPSGFLGGITYLASDLNADGGAELIVSGGADLYAFDSPGNDSYSLWYFKSGFFIYGIETYRFWNDDVPSLLLGNSSVDSLGRFRRFTEVHRPGVVSHVGEDSTQEIGGFEISQNHPNPFNPITTIGYTLPGREHVRVAVIDILGQEIAVLTDGIQEAGEHIVQRDAREMASGVYFYRLNASGRSITRKMLLVR